MDVQDGGGKKTDSPMNIGIQAILPESVNTDDLARIMVAVIYGRYALCDQPGAIAAKQPGGPKSVSATEL